MDEQEFRDRADQALEDLFQRLSNAPEGSGFEADFNGGALVIEFDDFPAKFVVSPNAPVKQIWVSANLRSHKLSWNAAQSAFVSDEGATLAELIASNISQQMGGKVNF